MMLLVALHAQVTRLSDEPASRKRIRLANAGLMMLTLPLLAAGFSLVDPRRHPGTWALVWMAALGLLAMNVGLAVLDTLNTLRLISAARRELRRELTKPLAAPRAGGGVVGGGAGAGEKRA
ncbi:MAG: hypothetical protein SFZ24_11620 [Planctomycetota bacterium]|nr:hypothetical protein [Planctomycetota bacterium]